MTILERSKANAAVAQYPAIAARLPMSWLEKWTRRGQIADAHRVYRMLAAGGVGWGDEQLAHLDALIGRLAGRDPSIDRKLDELWNADENRVDSLTTELLVADELLARGHALVVEPAIGTSKPEYLVDGRVLVEVKTYCSPKRDFPFARLKFEITHQVNSGCSLELLALTGTLTANDVGPLVKQLARKLDRANAPTPGKRCDAQHGAVTVTIEVSCVYPELTEGSFLTTCAAVVDPDEAVDDFDGWLLGSAKEAAAQMKDYPGANAFRPRVTEALCVRVREKHPRLLPVIAQRHANFGQLSCVPSLAAALSEVGH
jgi:hypothetical protein